jgi:bacterial/archaeal transporter family protein
MPRWLFWSLVAVFSWGVWAVFSKVIGDRLSVMHTQALSTIGLIPILLAMGVARRSAVRGSRARGIIHSVAAGVLNVVGLLAFFHALNLGGEAATVVLVPATGLYPLVTAVLGFFFLKETLSRIQIAGIIGSLVAIYLLGITDEKGEGLVSAWLLYALVPIVTWGVAGVLQKLATNHISAELATLWFMGVFVPVSAVILVLDPLPASVPGMTWLLVFALGFFFALGNYGLLAAFAAGGKAAIIIPLTALYPLVSVVIAVAFLKAPLGYGRALGVGLALVSAVALSIEPKRSAPATVHPEPVSRVTS